MAKKNQPAPRPRIALPKEVLDGRHASYRSAGVHADQKAPKDALRANRRATRAARRDDAVREQREG